MSDGQLPEGRIEADSPAGRIDDPSPAGRVERVRRAAARIDSHSALVAFADRVRRGLPGDDRYGDPLSTASDEPGHAVARQVRDLNAARPSVTRELGLGALQVWQALSESAGRGRGDRDVAVLFTDLAGFSSWALEAGDEATVELLREMCIAVEDAVADERGTVVKRMGDGVMAVFTTPDDAVRAALAAIDALREVEVAGYRPRLRAGVHLGRPRKLGGDYLGVDVNIAARVMDAAKPGEVAVSDTACAALAPDTFTIGRAKKLRAPGAPRDLRVSVVRGLEA